MVSLNRQTVQKHLAGQSMISPRISWILVSSIILVNVGLYLKHLGEIFTVAHTPSLRASGVATAARIPRLGDGCYHVFMDVGANIGVHGRFLFEPHKFPHSKISVPLFDEQYGKDRANEDYCVFAVEANPNRWSRLKNVSEAYATMGWRYNYVQAAAADQDGVMVFHHQGDDKYNEWGFSVKKRAKDTVNGSGGVNVPSVRLSEWIQREILEREIPENSPSGRQYAKPIIGMKMDIEGSEYIVLPDLLLTGVFCKLGFAFGEVHPYFAPLNFTGQRVDLTTSDHIKTYQDALKTVMKASRNCPTEFLFDIDDEAYLYDGVPFPNAE